MKTPLLTTVAHHIAQNHATGNFYINDLLEFAKVNNRSKSAITNRVQKLIALQCVARVGTIKSLRGGGNTAIYKFLSLDNLPLDSAKKEVVQLSDDG